MKSLMRPFVGWILVLGGLISYLVLSVGMGVYQQVPWLHLVLGLVGTGILVFAAASRPGILRIAGAALGVILVTFFAWWTLDYSSYTSPRFGVAHAQESAPASPADDEAEKEHLAVSIPRLADLSLQNAAGETVRLLAPEERARATLIVLYRGYW